MYGGIRVSTPEDFPLGAIDVIAQRPYEGLPQVVQDYVVRRATTETAVILGMPALTRAHSAKREEEAMAALMRDQIKFDRRSMLIDSQSVSSTVGSLTRRPANTRRRIVRFPDA